MAGDDIKATVRSYIQEVWNHGNWTAIEQLCAPEVRLHLGGSSLAVGSDVHAHLVGGWRSAFPDLVWTIEDMVAEGDKVACRFVGRGSHTGEAFPTRSLGSIPPSGTRVTVGEIAIYRVADGKVAECWAEVDTLGLMHQLGAIPQPGAAGT